MNYRWKIPTESAVFVTEILAADRISAAALLNNREIFERLLLVPHPYSEADFDDFYQRCQAYLEKHGHPASFAIRDVDGTMVGGVGFKELVKGHRCDIGYWLGRPYWGQGIMTSVVRAMTEFAVREWNLVRVSAHVFSTNAASAQVLKKAGFEYEGRLKKCLKKGEQFLDAKVYARITD